MVHALIYDSLNDMCFTTADWAVYLCSGKVGTGCICNPIVKSNVTEMIIRKMAFLVLMNRASTNSLINRASTNRRWW